MFVADAPLFFEEALVANEIAVECPECKGAEGHQSAGRWIDCATCNGEGVVWKKVPTKELGRCRDPKCPQANGPAHYHESPERR